MKIFNILTLFGLLLASGQVQATPYCASQLVSPDKSQIIRIIGDYHLIPCEKDKLNRMALFEKTKEHANCLFLVEDLAESDLSPENKKYLEEIQEQCRQEDVSGFLLGLVADAKTKNFKAKGIDNRPEMDDGITWKERFELYKKYTEEQYKSLLPIIPKELRNNFDTLYKKIKKHLSEYREDCFNYYHEYYAEKIFFFQARVFDYVILSHILRNSSDHSMIYVCVGGAHGAFICSALQQLGYVLTPGSNIPNIGLNYQDIDVKREFKSLTTPLDLEKTLGIFDNNIPTHQTVRAA